LPPPNVIETVPVQLAEALAFISRIESVAENLVALDTIGVIATHAPVPGERVVE